MAPIEDTPLTFPAPVAWFGQLQLQQSAKAADEDEDEDEDEDDEDGDDDLDADDDDSDEDDDDDDDEPLGPKGLKALKAERAKNAALTKKLKAARKGGKAAADDDGDEDDPKVAAARLAGTKTGDAKVRRMAARLALSKAGLIDGVSDARAIRMLDGLDDLEVDDDGDVEGLEDLIEEFKDDNPALFAKVPRRSPASRDGGRSRSGEDTSEKRKLTATERQALQLQRGARRS